MSAVVSPASAIAARQPSSVSSSGSRYSRRPISDWPTPVMHARRSMISFVVHAHAASGLEQRDVHVAVGIGMVLERDAQRHADLDLVERAVHEVRREPHRRLLDDLDDRDDVRQLRARHPVLVVDRVRRERRAARHRLDREVLRVVDRADRLRRVDVVAAVLAAPEPQLAAAPPVQNSRLWSSSRGRMRNGGSDDIVGVSCIESRLSRPRPRALLRSRRARAGSPRPPARARSRARSA